jgi:proteic killer suppression protein
MIQSFAHKGLERYFETGNKSGIQPHFEKRIRLILGRLNASCESKDMNLPGLRLHALQGELQSFWAVTVSGNWRIIFRFKDEDVIDVNLVDYH